MLVEKGNPFAWFSQQMAFSEIAFTSIFFSLYLSKLPILKWAQHSQEVLKWKGLFIRCGVAFYLCNEWRNIMFIFRRRHGKILFPAFPLFFLIAHLYEQIWLLRGVWRGNSHLRAIILKAKIYCCALQMELLQWRKVSRHPHSSTVRRKNRCGRRVELVNWGGGGDNGAG